MHHSLNDHKEIEVVDESYYAGFLTGFVMASLGTCCGVLVAWFAA